VLKEFAKELKTKADATDQDRRKAAILDHWEHEEQSWKMLDHLLTVNDIDLSLEENGGLDEKDRIFIKELINGYPLGFKPSEKDNPRYEWGNPPPPYKGRGSDKIFLYEIVSNKRTGLDVDRLDYLQRDVQAALGQYSKTFERLSECVAVCTDQRGNLVLAYPEDEVQSVMETYTTRMSMYNKVYMHRKTLIMVCGTSNRQAGLIILRDRTANRRAILPMFLSFQLLPTFACVLECVAIGAHAKEATALSTLIGMSVRLFFWAVCLS
jgi:hypothetical protein